MKKAAKERMKNFGTLHVIRMLEQQQGLCFYCAGKLNSENATREHVLARSWGGGLLGNDNIVLACRCCNEAKSVIESLIFHKFGRIPLSSMSALFILRCMKLDRKCEGRGLARCPEGVYLRMATSVQDATERWIRFDATSIPQLDAEARKTFL